MIFKNKKWDDYNYRKFKKININGFNFLTHPDMENFTIILIN